MSAMSVASLAVSMLGCVLYVSLFGGSGLIILFVVVSLASVALPPIAKKYRLSKKKEGKVLSEAFEIVAIIIAGFNFFCVCFSLTNLPAIVGYMGWIISGVVYKMIKPKAQ